ncbi:MAG: hypothetical protein ACI92I_000258 [Acidimicrobiales bacterium]|jgi:hypothetical protein
METALQAVGDGKLTDDELGQLQRRLNEIVRRIEEGTITKKGALKLLQEVVKGKGEKLLEPCKRPHRSNLQPFVRPPKHECTQSLAPVRIRTQHYLCRLGVNRKLSETRGHEHFKKILHPEDVMALMWEAENIPIPMINSGRVPIQTILDGVAFSEENRAIVASAHQWLMTNIGREYLFRVIAATNLPV